MKNTVITEELEELYSSYTKAESFGNLLLKFVVVTMILRNNLTYLSDQILIFNWGEFE